MDEYEGFMGMLSVVIGAGFKEFKEEEASDARGRIREFFARHLADSNRARS
jgi:hypothetical protein